MLPAILKAHAHRKVRLVVQVDELAAAVGFVATRKAKFNYAEWLDLLEELDNCESTVAEFAEKKDLYFANLDVL